MSSKEIIKDTVILATGMGIGIGAVWYYFDKKYKDEMSKKIEEIMAESKQIKPVKSTASELPAKVNTVDEVKSTVTSVETTKVNYSKLINKEKYVGDESTENAEEETDYEKPYVISPLEFGEKEDEGYTTVSLMFYSDGLLADDMGEVIENIDETVGVDSLNHFGEYEDDSVFVRNDRLKIDYEILLNNKRLVDVRKQSPCPLEDEDD